MDGNINSATLQAILRRDVPIPPKTEEGTAKAAGKEQEYEAYSFGRIGIRPQLMLALRKANGQVRIRPYAMLQGIDTDNEHVGFTLDFSGWRVQVRGRNLERLFRYLWLQRVLEIIEVDTSSSFLEDDRACVIESLSFGESRMGPIVVTEVD